MEKIEYQALIEASPSVIWNVLWEDETYRKWTSVFTEGSHAVTDWKEGSKILFLDGKGQGMVSRVAKNLPEQYMSIEHIGIVKDDQEIYDGKQVEEWAGSLENYTLKKENGKTRLIVDMNISEESKEYFNNTWPKALDRIKQLSEQN